MCIILLLGTACGNPINSNGKFLLVFSTLVHGNTQILNDRVMLPICKLQQFCCSHYSAVSIIYFNVRSILSTGHRYIIQSIAIFSNVGLFLIYSTF